jgi:general secretion pathway protein M
VSPTGRPEGEHRSAQHEGSSVSRAHRRWREFAPGRWFDARLPRERALIAFAAVLVAGFAAWLLLWTPLTADIATLRAEASRSRTALAEGRRMAEAIPALARAAPAPEPLPARAAVERSATAAFGTATGLLIGATDDAIRVTLPAAAFGAVVGFVESLQREARLQLHEATLTARVEPGTVRAELVFRR